VKKIFAVTLFLMSGTSFGAQQVSMCRGEGAILFRKIRTCIDNPALWIPQQELKACLQHMKENNIDISQLRDTSNNTPLHFALSHSMGVLEEVREYFLSQDLLLLLYATQRGETKIDGKWQNYWGYTVFMLVAKSGECQLFKLMLNDLDMASAAQVFMIKNRKDNNNTVLDYAKSNYWSDIEITNYDNKCKKEIAEKITETSDLVLDLSKIVAEYATPVNPHDMEADREYEQFLQLKADLKTYVPEFQETSR
jgi:hypothetical protein